MTTNPPPTDADSTGESRPTPTQRQSDGPSGDPKEAYRRFARHAAFVLLALALLGFLPTRRLAGDAGLAAMAWAFFADLAASIAGTLPIWWTRHLHPSKNIGAQLGAMGLRLAVVLVLGLAIALGGLVPIPAFLVWLAIGHAGLLIADTLFARAITAYAMQHPIDPNSPARSRPAHSSPDRGSR